MINYNLGKIYKIVDNTNGNIYIGSTCCKLLCQRLRGHTSYYKRYINGKSKQYYSSFKILKNGDYHIELLENISCKNKDELLKRETYWINKLNCINDRKSNRNQKQYYIDNREKILNDCQNYSKKNKNKIKQYQKNYREYIKSFAGLTYIKMNVFD